MRILVVANAFPTEKYPLNGIFEWDQAKALKQHGHEIIFVAIDLRSIRRKRKFGLRIQESEGIKVYNISIPLGRVPKKILDHAGWFAFKKIYKIIKSEGQNIDIVHYHFGRTMSYIGLKAKQRFGLKYIATEHDSTVNKDQLSDNERAQLKKFYHEAEARIAVSEPFKIRLEEIYKEKFDYIPNIIDLKAINDCKKVPHEGFTFVSVGNLIRGKGMDVTIRAFSAVSKRCSNVNLKIIGEGVELENLREIVKENGIEDKVFFMGRLSRSEIKTVFETSDCFILLSRSETFGVSYIEAMAAGLPVIATKCGGPECFVNDENGILIDVDDKEQAVVAMTEMMRKKYDGNKLRQYCLDVFSPEIVSEKITELIVK